MKPLLQGPPLWACAAGAHDTPAGRSAQKDDLPAVEVGKERR